VVYPACSPLLTFRPPGAGPGRHSGTPPLPAMHRHGSTVLACHRLDGRGDGSHCCNRRPPLEATRPARPVADPATAAACPAVRRLTCGYSPLGSSVDVLHSGTSRVLLDHLRDTRTRRPAMPRCSGLWALPLQRPGSWSVGRRGVGSRRAATPHRGEQGVMLSSACSRWAWSR
jgi:hypothetical protein